MVIGLTGGIASGKSTVSMILREMGAEIVDADEIARAQLRPGTQVFSSVVAEFGDGIVLPSGDIDRRRLAGIVFGDPSRRRLLERLTHPSIVAEVHRLIESSGSPATVLDAPLLVEAGLLSIVDRLWVVWVDEETQIARLMRRDGIGRDEAVRRIRSQMSLQEKASLADVVIDNSGSQDATRRQVFEAWRRVFRETC